MTFGNTFGVFGIKHGIDGVPLTTPIETNIMLAL